MSDLSSKPTSSRGDRPLAAIILAAGKGKRMTSDLPKVAHSVAGQPMVRWVVQACRDVGAVPIVLVIGHGGTAVRDIFVRDDADLEYAIQDQQLGTGHATRCTERLLGGFDGDVLVLAGDGPLIRAQTLDKLVEAHRRGGAAATLATSVIPDPGGYGRIVRNDAGRFQKIVEHKDATEAQRAIGEVNPSYYCFDAKSLFQRLAELRNDNANGEFYITDVFELMLRAAQRVEVVDAVPPEDVLSINTAAELAEVDAILRARLDSSNARREAEVTR